jgi:hypothetical protein
MHAVDVIRWNREQHWHDGLLYQDCSRISEYGNASKISTKLPVENGQGRENGKFQPERDINGSYSNKSIKPGKSLSTSISSITQPQPDIKCDIKTLANDARFKRNNAYCLFRDDGKEIELYNGDAIVDNTTNVDNNYHL